MSWVGVIVVLVAAGWVACMVLVCALCVSAARGDASGDAPAPKPSRPSADWAARYALRGRRPAA